MARKTASRADDADARFYEMTQAPLGRTIVRLAVPSTVANIVTVTYNLTDTFYVGCVGTAAVAAAGVVMPLTVILKSIGLMFGMGSANRMSVALGKKNQDFAERLASNGFFTTLFVAAIIAAVAICLRDPLAVVLGSTRTIAPLAIAYMLPLLIVAPLNCATYVLNALLRFQGLAKESMIGLASGAIINIGLEPVFIFALHWGMVGAGSATAVCQVISFCLLLGLYRRHSVVPIRLSRYRLDSEVFHQIIAGGLPSLLRNWMRALGMDVLDLAANPYGDAAIAAMTIVNRIVTVSNSIRGGFGQGYQPVCGYNYGAKNYKRVTKGYWLVIRASFVVLGAIAIAQSIWAAPIVRAFQSNPAVVAYGVPALRWQSLTLPFTTVIVTFNMLSQTLGYTFISSFVGSGRRGIFLIPILLILPHFLGFTGVMVAQPLADILALLLALPYQSYILHRLDKGLGGKLERKPKENHG